MLTRRSFLSVAALSALVITHTGFAKSNGRVRCAISIDAQRLMKILKQKRSARAIGKAYLELEPKEADTTYLVKAICGSGLDLKRAFLVRDDVLLRTAIANRIRHDFIKRRTVMIDGWLLSRTEARICALHAAA